MTYTIATVFCGESRPAFPTHASGDSWITIDNSGNQRSPCECYQEILTRATVRQTIPDVICYIHSDVTIHDPEWLRRVLQIFNQPPSNYLPQNVAAVGFGGATSLGRPNLYKEPYNIWNLARGGYASNQTDAETHGERFTGVRRVAVLDAFFMAVRTDFLRSVGGWPTKHLTHHCLDLWLACEARRQGKEIWMVGASCTHHGGGASTGGSYAKAPWLQGGSIESDHTLPHRWLYDEYRDCLPFSV